MYIVTIYQDSSVQSVNTTIPSSTGVFDAVNVANLIKAGFNVDVRDIGEEPREADACGGKFVTCNNDDSPTFPEIYNLLEKQDNTPYVNEEERGLVEAEARAEDTFGGACISDVEEAMEKREKSLKELSGWDGNEEDLPF